MIYLLALAAIALMAVFTFIMRSSILDQFHRFKLEIVEQLSTKHSAQQEHQLQAQKLLHDTLRETLSHHSQVLTQSVENLTRTAADKLQQVNQLVALLISEKLDTSSCTFVSPGGTLIYLVPKTSSLRAT